MSDGLEQVRDALRTFAADRDWFQYHNPKNLTMALSGEVGELSALFQWLTPDEAAETASSEHPQRPQVEDELADVSTSTSSASRTSSTSTWSAAALSKIKERSSISNNVTLNPSPSLEPTPRWFRRRVLTGPRAPPRLSHGERRRLHTRSSSRSSYSIARAPISWRPSTRTSSGRTRMPRLSPPRTSARSRLCYAHWVRPPGTTITSPWADLVRNTPATFPTTGGAPRLPGVGPYIANAVLALAYGQRVPLVDPNAIRVIDRVFGISVAPPTAARRSGLVAVRRCVGSVVRTRALRSGARRHRRTSLSPSASLPECRCVIAAGRMTRVRSRPRQRARVRAIMPRPRRQATPATIR